MKKIVEHKQAAGVPIKRLLLGIFFLLILALIVLPFHPDRMFTWLDGIYELYLVQQQYHWKSNLFLGMDIFSGMGDMAFAVQYSLVPVYAMLYSTLKYTSQYFTIISTLIYALFSIQYFIGSFLLCRAVKINQNISLIAAWLITLLVMQLLPAIRGQPIFYPSTTLGPAIINPIFFSSLLLYCFSVLGKKKGFHSICFGLVTVIIGLYLPLICASGIVLFIPFFLVFGIALLCFAKTRKEIYIKLTTIFIILILLIVFKYPQFLLGLFLYSAPAFFPHTLKVDGLPLPNVSILFNFLENLFVGGSITACLGILGAILTIAFSPKKKKKYAVVFLFFVTLVILFGLSTVIFPSWYRGPASLYFEFALWPLYMAYACLFIRFLYRGVFFILPREKMLNITQSFLGKSYFLIILIFLVALAGNFIFLNQESPRRFNPFSKKSPAIVEYLSQQLALKPGSEFKGSVADFYPKVTPGAETSWIQQVTFDALVFLPKYQTSPRLVGLWYHDIPTLNEYSPTLSPALYLLLSKTLSRSIDKQTRNIFTFTKINIPLLRTLGVKYIITNNVVNKSDIDLVMSEEIDSQHGSLYLYRLLNTNLATYSPTQFKQLQNVFSFIALINQQKINFSKTAYVDSPITYNLVKPNRVKLYAIKNGVHIQATSSGTSTILLPILYSHCLNIEFQGKKSALFQIQRANLIQSLITFNTAVNADIIYKYGLLDHANCRLQDRADLKKLLQ